MEVQGIPRSELPFKGLLQPYSAWYTVIASTFFILITGFDVFFPGHFTVGAFFSSYAGVLLYAVP
jgi:amino acid transporter